MHLDGLGLTRRGYNGRKAALCLSYDVDRAVGFNNLEVVVDELVKNKLTATFNILTDWEYHVDWTKVLSVQNLGFEIGLHGAKHDIALGYRGKRRIKKEILSSLNASAPLHYKSYRAPALCMTPKLLDVIGELGFRCDSSLPMSNMYYKSVETCFPYPLDTEGSLWELPVSLQDSTLFLDLGFSSDEAIGCLLSTVDEIVAMGGVALLNLHPYVVLDHLEFHREILGKISSMSDVWICKQNELVSYLSAIGNHSIQA